MSRQFGFVFFGLSVIFGAIFCSATVEGRVLYVSYDGNNTPPHTSWETATHRVGLAVPYALPGDTIRIGSGVYYDPTTVSLNGGLTLIGAGSDSTRVSYTGTGDIQFAVDTGGFRVQGIRFVSHVGQPWVIGINFLARKDTLRIEGCIFESFAYTVYSAAKYLDIRNCQYFDCPTFSAGVTIYVGIGAGNGEITGCSFLNNRETYGGQTSIEMFFYALGDGNFRIARNVFSGYQRGIDCSLSNGLIIAENNLFINDILPPQQDIPPSFDYLRIGTPNAIVRNNFFEGCYGDTTRGRGNTLLYVGGGINNHIYNNIFIGRHQGVRIRYEWSYFEKATYSFDHNDFWLDAARPHFVIISPLLDPMDSLFCQDYLYDSDTLLVDIDSNLCRDPMFVDTVDYLLAAGSPCIDAGRPDILDQDGSRSDIGPFGGSAGKLYAYQDFAPATPESFTGTAKSTGATLQWLKSTESDLKYLALFKSTSGSVPIDSAHVIAYFHQFIDSLLRKTPDDCTFLSYTDTSYSAVTGGRYTIVAVDSIGLVSQPAAEVVFIGTDVDDQQDPPLPQSASLEQNYPNPFNSTTAIVYSLPNIGAQPATVRLEIFNLLGQLVRVLVDESQSPGQHIAYWDGRDRSGKEVASGTYFYKLSVGGVEYVKAKKLVLLK